MYQNNIILTNSSWSFKQKQILKIEIIKLYSLGIFFQFIEHKIANLHVEHVLWLLYMSFEILNTPTSFKKWNNVFQYFREIGEIPSLWLCIPLQERWFTLTESHLKLIFWIFIVCKQYQNIFWLVLKLYEVGIQEIRLHWFTLCYQKGVTLWSAVLFQA